MVSRIRWLLPFSVALTVVAGCSSPSPPTPTLPSSTADIARSYGTLSGTIELWAITKVPPLDGTVYVRRSDGARFTATASASEGFSMRVPSGAYTITARSPRYNSGLTDCTTAAVVTATAATRVVVVCEGF